MLKSTFFSGKIIYIFGLFSLFACEKMDQNSTLYQKNIIQQQVSSTTMLPSQDDLNNRKYVDLSDVQLPSLSPVRRVNILVRSPKTEEP
ncbi:hypothetical protein JZU61_03885, partial [bacterium]|nr:hypothetical protein [bacterium]